MNVAEDALELHSLFFWPHRFAKICRSLGRACLPRRALHTRAEYLGEILIHNKNDDSKKNNQKIKKKKICSKRLLLAEIDRFRL